MAGNADTAERYDFDSPIDRRNSDSTKWRYYGAGILPLWTADMDFRSCNAIIDALNDRIKHGIFGYCVEPESLREIIASRLARLYGWKVHPEWILLHSDVMSGIRRVCRAVASSADAIVVQPPVYPPILDVAKQNGSISQQAPLTRDSQGRWIMDLDRLSKVLTDRTRVLILCNPHNPVGRVFDRDELEALAEFCMRRRIFIASDEIHCDLVFSPRRHIPIASLDPEVARETVTHMAPSKTFNVSGLRCSFSIVPDPVLRDRLDDPHARFFAKVNTLGLVAAEAGFRGGEKWLTQVLAYLEENRALIIEQVNREMPGIELRAPEATYLAWLDCSAAGIENRPARFFHRQASVGLSDGSDFGSGGESFVRLNFSCSRATLREALRRMSTALRANCDTQ